MPNNAKRFADAELLLLESYTTLKSVQGDHSPPTLEAARRLVTLYQSWGKPQEAARYQTPGPFVHGFQTCSAHPLIFLGR
jgi:hypothetical protein